MCRSGSCRVLGLGGDGAAGLVVLVAIEPPEPMNTRRGFKSDGGIPRGELFAAENLGDESLRQASLCGYFVLGHVHEAEDITVSYPGQAFHNRESIDISGIVLDQGSMNKQTFGDVLRFWITKESVKQETLAEACGVSQSYISMLLANKKNPSVPLLNRITEFFNTDIADFFRQPSCVFDDFFLVPMLSARPKAGSGGLETDSEFMGWYSFKRNFLERKGNPLKMYLFRVVGDSMEKTLLEDDVVLVDTSQAGIVTGKIFLIRLGPELMVKRLETRPGMVKVISDNDHYSPIEITSADSQDMEIFGKMVWSCREY